MRIAVIGAGTYGSYVIDSLLRKYPDADITLFDVWQRGVKNEQEMGYYTALKQSLYKGLSDGRFFGFGGASDKWGGQLLTFTDNDFAHPNAFMREIIRVDKARKDEMLAKFKIENKYPEHHISDELFTKTGVWLSAFHRNFFNWFTIHKRKQVKIITQARVIRLNMDEANGIKEVVYLHDGKEQKASFDYYFLTAGAFESARILLSSGMLKEDKVYFSDHLSTKVFKIKGSTKIKNEDFIFRMRGTSLITKRMIGEKDNTSFYVHPVFNLRFPFFDCMKEVLFKHHFEWKYLWIALKDIPHCLGFAWAVLFKRRMYVLNNEWYLYVDAENPAKDCYITLSEQKDAFGIQGLDVYYHVGEKTNDIYDAAKHAAQQLLNESGVQYEVLADKIDVQTCEDIYHPFGMFDFKDMNDYFGRWSNMLVVTTGCLPRSGGINPTASLLPVVDEFVENHAFAGTDK